MQYCSVKTKKQKYVGWVEERNPTFFNDLLVLYNRLFTWKFSLTEQYWIALGIWECDSEALLQAVRILGMMGVQ
ncbi:hypothetical protein OA07_10680 [Aphanizomenon flos-aquae 2012/KM1/D3]|nr:hypothetical protein OA07_24630 [Aphanizomenon flos-aquae 2012/KM1/D3]KHG41549.1 hypothetical protein OA07_10680 [Aphanizomenon flos-aquae 2012/KM1/D3]